MHLHCMLFLLNILPSKVHSTGPKPVLNWLTQVWAIDSLFLRNCKFGTPCRKELTRSQLFFLSYLTSPTALPIYLLFPESDHPKYALNSHYSLPLSNKCDCRPVGQEIDCSPRHKLVVLNMQHGPDLILITFHHHQWYQVSDADCTRHTGLELCSFSHVNSRCATKYCVCTLQPFLKNKACTVCC